MIDPLLYNLISTSGFGEARQNWNEQQRHYTLVDRVNGAVRGGRSHGLWEADLAVGGYGFEARAYSVSRMPTHTATTGVNSPRNPTESCTIRGATRISSWIRCNHGQRNGAWGVLSVHDIRSFECDTRSCWLLFLEPINAAGIKSLTVTLCRMARLHER